MEPGDVAAAVRVVVGDYEEAGEQLHAHAGARSTASRRCRSCSTSADAATARWVRWAFSPQLAGRTGARKTQLEDLLVVATDVYTWKLLRIDRRLSARATTAAMTELCEAVVAR